VHDVEFKVEPKAKTVGEYFRQNVGVVPEEFIQHRIDHGQIFVNFERIASTDHPIRKWDHLGSVVHMHERPVLDDPVEVIAEDEDVLVVNKPASMLIYPATGYRLNTVLFILANERGSRNLRILHRLDKHTSGVLIFAKNSSPNVEAFTEKFHADAEKEYLALVDGDFPETPAEGLACHQPIDGFKSKHCASKTFSTGSKECTTVFHKIKAAERPLPPGVSLVHCKPQQGRTHQIRIHLKAMGHPIVNDVLYNDTDVRRWQPTLDVIAGEGFRRVLRNKNNDVINKKVNSDVIVKKDWKSKLSENVGKPQHLCYECLMGNEFEEWKTSEAEFICLHSWKYRVGDRQFEAKWPKWATDEQFQKSLLDMRKRRAKTLVV